MQIKRNAFAGLMLLSLVATAAAQTIGLNTFDMGRQYLGFAGGGDGSDRYRNVSVAMANKAMDDAVAADASFLRISASGFGPSAPGQHSELELWVTDPQKYWSRFDELVAAIEQRHLRVVFGLLWNPAQFPILTGDTTRDLVADPKSKSYAMASRYVREFVKRYRGRNTILFYELTNEFNLTADLDVAGRCRKEGKRDCAAKGNYTTDELIDFTRRLAVVAREADPQVKLSSGFSVPRLAAEHLRAHPEWIDGKADFKPDTPEQFDKNLIDIHSAVDIIGVHIYPDSQNLRFGTKDMRSTGTLDETVRAARKAGKPVFIGEFGDAQQHGGDDASFTVRMLKRIAELKPDYSAPWVWEFYQTSTYQTNNTPDSEFNIEPGFTDALIEQFRATARSLAQQAKGAHVQMAAHHAAAPHVVLTWPLGCSAAKPRQMVHAVASGDSGEAPQVDFLVDGKVVATSKTPPYQAELSLGDLSAGAHELVARATDAKGLKAESRSVVVSGSAGSVDACPRVFAGDR